MCITHTCVDFFFSSCTHFCKWCWFLFCFGCVWTFQMLQQYQQQKNNIAIIIVNLLANYGHKYCHIYLNKLANDDFTTTSSWELPIYHSKHVPRVFRRKHYFRPNWRENITLNWNRWRMPFLPDACVFGTPIHFKIFFKKLHNIPCQFELGWFLGIKSNKLFLVFLYFCCCHRVIWTNLL